MQWHMLYKNEFCLNPASLLAKGKKKEKKKCRF